MKGPADSLPRGTGRPSLSDRELATVLAALRYHQEENLHEHRAVVGDGILEIASNAGVLKPLDVEEVDHLCEKLNAGLAGGSPPGLTIRAPHKDGDGRLYRVVYVIDLPATGPSQAAEQAYRLMADPKSLPPVLDVLDHRGAVTRLDLAQSSAQRGGQS